MKKIHLGLFLFVSLILPVFAMADTCTPFNTVVASDPNTTVVETDSGDQNAVLTSQSGIWTSIPGASWIWKTFQTEDPNASQTYTFKNTFTLDGEVNTGILNIASDDYFVAHINNTEIASEFGEGNFLNSKTYDVASLLQTGSNEISIDATNAAYFYAGEGTVDNNPAGLIFSLSVDGQTCIPDNNTEDGNSNSSGSIVKKIFPGSRSVSTTNTTLGQVLGATNIFNDTKTATTHLVANDEATTTDIETPTTEDTTVIPLTASVGTILGDFDIDWKCILIALIIILVIYIVGELVNTNKRATTRRLSFYAMATALAVVILLLVYSCPILPLFIMYVILSALAYYEIV